MLWRFLALGVVLGATLTSASAVDPGVLFVENKNQWPSAFRYGAEFKDARVYVADNRLYFIQYSSQPGGQKGQAALKAQFSESDHLHQGYTALTTFEVSFQGARQPVMSGTGLQPTLYNYYLGNDPAAWGSGARSFGGVAYAGLYDGIDLRVYSEGGLMKSDWIVSPCADVKQINLRYNGMEDVALHDGRLHVTTSLGTLIEERPIAYQLVDGVRRPVTCNYLLSDNTVTFDFPDGYDTNYELVIDPILIFSSYSGSSSNNWGNTATPDSRGNLYSGGAVVPPVPLQTFPLTAGAFQTLYGGGEWDVGIIKYDSVGWNQLYVTYLGGAGVETPQSLVVNSKDELLVLGATSSANFPGTTPGTFKQGVAIEPLDGVNYTSGTDIFIAKLSPDGTKLFSSTYLGGTANDAINFVAGNISSSSSRVESPLARNYGDQLRGDITVDHEDNVFIASTTRSADFPVNNIDAAASFHGGTHDAVVVKLKPDLSSIIWSRLVGGSLTDVAYSIKIGDNGRVYVAGGTTSTDMQGMNGLRTTAPGNTDGWIVELKPDGSGIVNGTYMGTSAYDQVYFIDIGTEGDVLAFGQTKGQYPILPIERVFSQPGGGQFLHKLDANLKTTEFSTVFGISQTGSINPNISPTAFLVNDCDNIYMAGWGGRINSPNYRNNWPNYLGGNTTNLPITPDAFQPTTVQGDDFYLMVLSGDAERLVYATYLGGATSVTHVDGGTSRFDKRGVVYHAVCAGCFSQSDFPAHNVPVWRRENHSLCSNAAFKFDLSSLKARIQTYNNVSLSIAGVTRVCLPDGIVFANASIGGEIFQWDLGDGTKVTKLKADGPNFEHHYAQPGSYTVKLTSIDESTCIGVDSTEVVIVVTKPAMRAGPDKSICNGTSLRLEASGGTTYAWKGEKTGFTSAESSPLVAPEEDERYFISMTDAAGCASKDTVLVHVVPGMDLKYELETTYDCITRPYVTLTNKTELKADETAFFGFGDGTTSSSDEEVHVYGKDGIYQVTLTGRKEECVYEVGETVSIVTIRIPNVITPADSPDKNDTFKVLFGDPVISAAAVDMSLLVIDRWGVEVYSAHPYLDDWSASNVDEGVYYYELEITGYPTCKGWVHVIK